VPFPPQPLHHGQHRRPREAAGRAELVGGFADREAAPVGNESQQGQFLLANGLLGHMDPLVDYMCRYRR
jgi:hypothetical protein